MQHDFGELRLTSVTRRFGTAQASHAALESLSLTVQRGEFIALLGPSGCGKSTALNCIAGLLSLSAGSIWLDERRIDVLAPEKRGFGMVFQNYALFPHMSVKKNIGFGLLMQGVSDAEHERRVRHALSLVQLEGYEDKLPGQLSGGQQQRVAIARAIVIEPSLVLMDEPLSNLDAKLRLEMRAEIRRIHKELGRTTIYVTHDQDEALSLADRIVVMRRGVAQQVAPPKDVYELPANLHVARFMGYRNVIEADVISRQGQRAVVRGRGFELTGTLVDAAAGQRAAVAIRPDEMSVVAAGSPNALGGKVTSLEYGGRDSLVSVLTDEGDSILVRSAAPTSVGDRIHIAAPPERVLVYSPANDAN